MEPAPEMLPVVNSFSAMLESYIAARSGGTPEERKACAADLLNALDTLARMPPAATPPSAVATIRLLIESIEAGNPGVAEFLYAQLSGKCGEWLPTLKRLMEARPEVAAAPAAPAAADAALAQFLGPPHEVGDHVGPYAAFLGTNKYLRDIVVTLITDTTGPFILPWREVGQEIVRFDEVRFDEVRFVQTLSEIRPEGVPRLGATEDKGGALVRYGIAFMLEEGFEATERGKLCYKMNLEQLRNAIVETARLGMLRAVLQCSPAGASALSDYAVLQRGGAEAMCFRAREVFMNNGSNATCVMIPHAMVAHREAIMAATRCMSIVITRGFEQPCGDYTDPLLAERSIGEYYLMPAGCGALHIEDETLGCELAPVTVADALRASGRFDDDGRLTGLGAWLGSPAGDAQVPPDMFLCARGGAWAPVAYMEDFHAAFVPALDPALRGVAVTLPSLLLAARAGVALPFAVLLLRPAITRVMASAVFMREGKETGETLLRVADEAFQLAFNAPQRMLIGNFTASMKSFIYQPSLVHVARDALAVRYVGGNDRASILAALLPPGTRPPAVVDRAWLASAPGAGFFEAHFGDKVTVECHQGHCLRPDTGVATPCRGHRARPSAVLF